MISASTEEFEAIIAEACGSETPASQAAPSESPSSVYIAPSSSSSAEQVIATPVEVSYTPSSGSLADLFFSSQDAPAFESTTAFVAAFVPETSSSSFVEPTSTETPFTPEAPTSTETPTSTEAPPPPPTSEAPPPPEITSTSEPPAVATPTPSNNNADASGSLSQADIDAYLKGHNDVRANHGANALTWNNDLSAAAQKWADNCVFEHSGGVLGSFGENLSAGSGDFSIAAGIKGWTDEVKDYNPSNPVASHFTQVVWKDTTEVGCAVASCGGIFDSSFGDAQFYVCEYLPPGNFNNLFAENVQV
uniref:Pathogenesis related protein 1 n=1 Tax=Flammulina velutipes TaxID=38945 RepID=A0A1B2U6Y2_FLAVE|nr:pathogenesis related protein 1 [Flammulina velutipes]WKW83177.1 PR1 [Flammulina filiformis]